MKKKNTFWVFLFEKYMANFEAFYGTIWGTIWGTISTSIYLLFLKSDLLTLQCEPVSMPRCGWNLRSEQKHLSPWIYPMPMDSKTIKITLKFMILSKNEIQYVLELINSTSDRSRKSEEWRPSGKTTGEDPPVKSCPARP